MGDSEAGGTPKPAGPCVLVIFGITGDLTKRLLMPALYNLARHKLLPEHFAIAGFAISDPGEQQLRDRFADDLKGEVGQDPDAAAIRDLVSKVRLIASDFDSDAGWQQLRVTLDAIDRECGTAGNYLFYLATAPELFLKVIERLAKEGYFQDQGHWRRVIIEKPFGHDLNSARELNRQLLAVIREDQIYRIDHYLGKETVQNIMVFRFANGIFEPVWNRRYIDHIQITVAESVGVERRGGYYDHTGALRDMVPNHLVQLLALTAMEPPSSFQPAALQNEQVKVLEAMPAIHPDTCATCVVRGQYTAGNMDGTALAGYRQEPLVNCDSGTETYVALRLAVDNWRWAGVPFFLRTGKRMACRKTEVAIQFRNPPLALFRRASASMPQPNRLIIGIQPQEDISLEFEGKVPGPIIDTETVGMNFDYADYFGRESRTGYETLLYDAMMGDSSLFKRADMIERGWSIIQPILDAWSAGQGGEVAPYPAGSAGPEAAEAMLDSDGRTWRTL